MKFAQIKVPLKWSFGVLGAILIGALGSGVWQSVLGPAIHASTRWMLDFVSLGLKSYKDGIYQQIAADDQAAVAVETLARVTAMSGLAIGLLTGTAVGVSSAMKRELRELLDDSGEPPGPKPDITMETSRLERVAELKHLTRVRLVLYASLLGITFFFVNASVSTAKLSYINSADAHFHYILRLASPYLDAHEQAELESDFAQIRSREDYVALQSRLEGECKAHGRMVTKFDPW